MILVIYNPINGDIALYLSVSHGEYSKYFYDQAYIGYKSLEFLLDNGYEVIGEF